MPPVRPNALGNLKVGTRDVADNMLLGRLAPFALFLATGGRTEHAQLAQRILQAFQPRPRPTWGFFWCEHGRFAIERAVLSAGFWCMSVGGPASDPRTQALLLAAHKPYRYEKFIQPLDPTNADDAEHIENLGYPTPEQPTAHIMVATDSLAPTVDAEVLIETIQTAAPTMAGMPDLSALMGEGD